MFIHSSIDRHLRCFHLLATVNNATMKVGTKVAISVSVFKFIGYIPKNKTAGSTLAGVAQWIECQPANQRVTG